MRGGRHSRSTSFDNNLLDSKLVVAVVAVVVVILVVVVVAVVVVVVRVEVSVASRDKSRGSNSLTSRGSPGNRCYSVSALCISDSNSKEQYYRY